MHAQAQSILAFGPFQSAVKNAGCLFIQVSKPASHQPNLNEHLVLHNGTILPDLSEICLVPQACGERIRPAKASAAYSH